MPRYEYVRDAGKYVTGYEIEVLENSIYYFLQCVFIAILPDSVRLVAIQNNRIIHDECYKTIRGAKIAFTKYYSEKCWKNVQPVWTHRYPPLSTWMEKRIEIMKKNNQLREAS